MRNWRELLEISDHIGNKKIVVGYDGFIDTTARPIAQTATDKTDAKMFETIKEFGEFLVSKANKSCSVELKVESKHLGGNLAYLSKGARAMGLNVTGIGMLGDGGTIDEVFRKLDCTLYSFGGPGQSTCLEFQDGKVMLAPAVTLEENGWDLVRKATDDKAPELFVQADLIALVNWSELSFATELWRDTYLNSLLNTPVDKGRFAFFDLCDISRKSGVEIEEVLRMIGCYGEYRTTILSMNENEMQVVMEKVLEKELGLGEAGQEIREKYHIDEILVHTVRKSMLMNQYGTFQKETDFIEHPVMSTGAGDHFNAAACFGAVMGLNWEERLNLANRASSMYVATGKSPTLLAVVDSLMGHG